jgi:hypothetical protein
MDEIHYQLEKAKIPHICHYREANSIGAFDLSAASTICTECRINRGEFTIADIILGRIDPLDRKKAYDEDYRKYHEDRELRRSGKLPKHVVYTAYLTWDRETNKDLIHPVPYERYDCKMEHGSSSSSADRICRFCKESIDT